MNLRKHLLPFALALILLSTLAHAADGPGRWPVEKANAWLEQHGWLRGSNYLPSTAVNQLEMWQADTWDEATIDRELGYAAAMGFNSMRVFLHDLLWEQDAEGFAKRIDRFLSLAEKHKIGVLVVLFDSCWHPLPKLGPQPAPIPHTHNSGWVQSPGVAALQNPTEHARLRAYVTGVVKRFANDKRIHGWDLWNEPDNWDGGAVQRPNLEPKNKLELVAALIPQVFAWAREANPTQPLTSGVWLGDWSDDAKLSPTQRVQLEHSDVISFHNYGNLDQLRRCVEQLRRFNRPILCTEFMARPNGSVFDPHLGWMKQQKVAAYTWGFVAGKSQTNYPWDSWKKKYTAEPPLWFHDIVRADGTPYRAEEAAYIRAVTGVAAPEVVTPALPGHYKNPVLRGDYPDPSVVRVGEDYYATATSSEWAPHFPILHSRDLVNWRVIGAVFEKLPEWAVANFWAPEIQHWNGRFYIYYTARKKGGPLAVAVATAEKPEGPWTDHGPLVAQDAGSIDGVAVDDEKGQRWLLWKEDGNSRGQPTPIWAQRLDATGTKLTGEMHELLRNDTPWEGALVEGPYVVRRGDWFYMIYAGNACCGRGCNYSTGVARAKSLLGPWEKYPRNPILTTSEHFRGPGHGSVVTDPRGRLFFLYHSYKLPSFVETGRELMLDELTFGADGWPEINGGKGPSVTAPSPFGAEQQREEVAFFDDFTGANLQPGWQWPLGNKPAARVEGGNLVLAPTAAHAARPLGAVVARSCTSGEYVATTVIEAATLKPGVLPGISAFGDNDNALGVVIDRNGKATLWEKRRGQRKDITHLEGPSSERFYLRMTALENLRYQFAVSTDGREWRDVGQPLNGDYLPPWDRAVRIALTAGGAEGAEARFGFLRVEPAAALRTAQR